MWRNAHQINMGILALYTVFLSVQHLNSQTHKQTFVFQLVHQPQFQHSVPWARVCQSAPMAPTPT